MTTTLNNLNKNILDKLNDETYFYQQVGSALVESELRDTDMEVFDVDDDVIETDKTTKSGVKYMDIARFLICNMDMGVFFDYDNKTHSHFIYEGLDANQEAAELLAELYKNIHESVR